MFRAFSTIFHVSDLHFSLFRLHDPSPTVDTASKNAWRGFSWCSSQRGEASLQEYAVSSIPSRSGPTGTFFDFLLE